MNNKTIHGYTITKPLGEGGMAEVWYAENSIGRRAAVKIMHRKFIDEPQIVQRFENEAKVMIRLSHKHIREVYDYALIDGKPCILMEYIEGEDLSARLKKGERFSDSDIKKWWNQAVDALNYTHGQGIVHRDIKPSNLFVTPEGDLKLLDFGIAKVGESTLGTLSGQQLGTPLYMSPEQVRSSKHVDYRTDAYSLAVTFFHLLTGRAPYDATTDSLFDIQQKIVQVPLCLGELPVEWQGFLKPYLAKNADERAALQPFSATAAGRDAAHFDFAQRPRHVSTGTAADETIIEQSDVTTIEPAPPPKDNKDNKDKGDKGGDDRKGGKGIIWGIVAFLVAAVLVGGFLWWNGNEQNRLANEERQRQEIAEQNRREQQRREDERRRQEAERQQREREAEAQRQREAEARQQQQREAAARQQAASQPQQREVENVTVRGVVTDEQGEPLIGTNVIALNTRPLIGTVANIVGEYSISVPKGSVLQFNFGGFTREFIINQGKTLNVTIQVD